MELRRAAGALLRSSMSSTSPSLALRLLPAYFSPISIETRMTAHILSRRPLSTSEFPSSSSTSSPQSSSPQPADQPAASSPVNEEHAAPNAEKSPVLDKSQSGRDPAYNSIKEAYNRSTFGSNFLKPAPSYHNNGQNRSHDTMSMLQSSARESGHRLPSEDFSGDNTTASLYEHMIPPLGGHDKKPRAYPALGPSLGRSVEVNPAKGMDLGSALRKLDAILNMNKVRSDLYKQKFHERPGLKRKRLKSERWRKRFREGFKYLTARVTKLRKQGW